MPGGKMTTEEFVNKFLHRIVRRYGPHSSLDLAYGYVVNIMEDPATKELHARVVWERNANSLNVNNARWYSAKFMNSVGIKVCPNRTMSDVERPIKLKHLVSLERKLIAETFGHEQAQQELPLEQNNTPKETVEEPEKKEDTSNDATNIRKNFIVLETSQLNPLTREEADKLLRKASIQQPGKTFTLAQMVLHSKYPIDPLIVKA